MATHAPAADLREQARALPDASGVYVWRSAEGTVLYVGKATSLKKRVASYFATVNRDRKSAELVSRAASIEPIVVASASEALLLEQQLIKRHRPPLNVRLRDDKSYPYIAVTLADEYPRVLFTRERHRSNVRYFGPYASAQKVRTTLETLNKIFPYRPCEGPAPGRRSGVPCLDYHIGRCGAPCVGLITREQYRAVILDVIAFLEGRTNKIERDLERRMRDASDHHQFEEAARTRNRLMAVRHLSERQAVSVGTGTYDAVALAVEADVANVQLLAVRGGRIEERRSHYLENAAGESEDELLARFLLDYYDTQVGIPPLICTHANVADEDLIAGFLTQRRGAAVELRVAERGDKRRVVAMALRNAELGVRHDVLRAQRTKTRRIEALEELRESLNLEALPIRIECFDISNLQDTNAVASMVVFEDGTAKRSDYRRFGIRHGARTGRLPLARGGGLAPLRAPPPRRRRRLRPQLRDAPEPARDRRRQGPARRRARRDADVRPAARRGRLAGQARGGGLPPGPRPTGRPAARVAGACSCCSRCATRPIASRCAATARAAPPGRRPRCSTPCRASAPCAARR